MPWWAWVFAFPAAVLLGILTAVLVAFASGPPWRRGTLVEPTVPFPEPPPDPPTLTWDEYDADPHGAMERAKVVPVRVVGEDPSDEMVLTWARADEGEGDNG
jgi:hypothetical protein